MDAPSPPQSSKVTVDQVLSAGYNLLDWLNFYWNFYVGSVAVLIGWLFSAKTPWVKLQQAAVTFVFLGFVVVSLIALRKTYRALDATTSDLRVRWGTDEPFKRAIITRLSQKGWGVAICFHVLIDAVVIYFVWNVPLKGP